LQSVKAEGTANITVKQNTSSYQPFVNADFDFVAKEGSLALDFGQGEQRFLGFDKSLESIRSVYMVWKLKPNSGTYLLGSSNTTMDRGSNSIDIYDFHRGYAPGTQGCKGGSMFHGSNSAKSIRNGEVFTNGVQIASNEITSFKPVDDEWQLVEVHSTAGVHASAIANDRNFQYYGDMAMAELIVYERELTEREKVSTRNYLLKKWFGKNDAELSPVPEAWEQTLEIPVLSVDGTVEISAMNVKTLAGKGTLVKTGEGELSLLNLGSYTGSMVVEQGSVNFKGEYRAEPKMATNGLRMRLAADEGLKLIDNSDGTRGVLEWANTVEDDWKAVAPTGYVINAEKNGNISKLAPLYMENTELKGLPVVDMPKYRCFRFIDPDGNYASVKEIRNVFWVVGSQRGGGWLLGGGNLDSSTTNPKYFAWHRGGNANDVHSSGTTHIDWLISASAYTSVENSNNCVWRKNSQIVSPKNESLSGGWDQLTYSALATIETDAKEYPGASGLAFDGRIFNGDPVNIAYSDRTGNQTLAEVLIYTNELAEAEILQTEAYLNCKWGLNNAIPTRQESVRLVVAEGASVGTESGFGAFAAIEGSGTVEGDVTAAELVADFSKSSFFTVSGTFSIPDGLKIQVRNPPADLPAEVKLLQAGGIDGWQLRKNISVAGVDADKVRVRLSVRDGALYARLTDGKLAIIVR
jgi:autotransporter-associated beta strand protein